MENYNDESTISPPGTLQELINQLHCVFDRDHVNVEYVQQLMTSYKSNPKDWKSFAKFDQHRYTRNLVDEGNGKFNLIVLCWGEGQGSSIHSHAGAHCFVKVLDGNLSEVMYNWPSKSEGEASMAPCETHNFGRDGVTYMRDEMGLHRVENVSHSDRAVSLHLYAPPFDMCQTFDERTGHSQACKVTFWSKYGKRTPFTPSNSCAVVSGKEPMPITDQEAS